MSHFGIIYKAELELDGRKYIGQTRNSFDYRIYSHLISESGSVFHSALSFYGEENFSWEIIDFVDMTENQTKDQELLNEKEKYWIDHFRTFVGWNDNHGFNSTRGGGNYIHSSILSNEEVRIVKLLLRDTVMTLKEIGDMFDCSAACIFDIKRERTGEGIIINEQDELPENYKYLTDLYPSDRYEIYVFNTDDCSYVGTFKTQIECSRKLGIDRNNIPACLSGKRRKIENYVFIYKKDYTEDWKNTILPKIQRNAKRKKLAKLQAGMNFSVYVFKTGRKIGDYTNQKLCADELGVSVEEIIQCLVKNKIYSKDYIFIFEEELTDTWLSQLIEKSRKVFKQGSNTPFRVYKLTGEYIGTWNGLNRCARELNFPYHRIKSFLTKENLYSPDYVFIYNHEFNEEKLNSLMQEVNDILLKQNKTIEPFLVYKTTGELIGEWNNIQICAIDLELESTRAILDSLSGVRRSPYNHYIFINKNGLKESEIKEMVQKIKESPDYSKNRKVLVYDSKGDFLGRWENQVSCVEELILDQRKVSNCLNGREISHKGYQFRYADDLNYKPLMDVTKNLRSQPVVVYKGVERLGIYASQIECIDSLKHLKLSQSAVSCCLYGKRKTHKGLRFEYAVN